VGLVPFKAPAGYHSGRYFFGHNSSAARDTELFKPSTDSGGLLVSIEKNCFSFGFGVLCGCCHKKGCFALFWPGLPASGRKTQRAIFLAQVFLESRLSSQSLETLIDFIAYGIAQKPIIGKNSTPTNADPGCIILLQALRWRCVGCVIHHERDVPEEQHHYTCSASKQ